MGEFFSTLSCLGHFFELLLATTLNSFSAFKPNAEKTEYYDVHEQFLSLHDKRRGWLNNGKCSIFKRARMGYRSHYWLQLLQTLGLFSPTPSFLYVSLEEPLTLIFLHYLSVPCMSLSKTTLPSASLQILPPSLPRLPDCDAWLSVFSKSPLVAGTRPPPLPQTEIKTQSMAARWAAWKWEDGGRARETEGDGGREGRMDEKTPWYWPEAREQWGRDENGGQGSRGKKRGRWQQKKKKQNRGEWNNKEAQKN